MDLQERMEVLLRLAGEVGLQVRREPLGGEGGGFCVLRGKRILFIDTTADTESRYETTLAALAPLAELDQHYLPPEVRQDLARARGGPETPRLAEDTP
jgi:hypothetical protein